MRKKMISAVLASVMAVSLLGGCSGGGSQSSSQADQEGSSQTAEAKSEASSEAPAEGAGEKVKVRILTRYSNPDSVRKRYFMDMVAKFQEENPDIELEDVSISDENSRDTLFKTSWLPGIPLRFSISSAMRPTWIMCPTKW